MWNCRTNFRYVISRANHEHALERQRFFSSVDYYFNLCAPMIPRTFKPFCLPRCSTCFARIRHVSCQTHCSCMAKIHSRYMHTIRYRPCPIAVELANWQNACETGYMYTYQLTRASHFFLSFLFFLALFLTFIFSICSRMSEHEENVIICSCILGIIVSWHWMDTAMWYSTHTRILKHILHLRFAIDTHTLVPRWSVCISWTCS